MTAKIELENAVSVSSLRMGNTFRGKELIERTKRIDHKQAWISTISRNPRGIRRSCYYISHDGKQVTDVQSAGFSELSSSDSTYLRYDAKLKEAGL